MVEPTVGEGSWFAYVVPRCAGGRPGLSDAHGARCGPRGRPAGGVSGAHRSWGAPAAAAGPDGRLRRRRRRAACLRAVPAAQRRRRRPPAPRRPRAAPRAVFPAPPQACGRDELAAAAQGQQEGRAPAVGGLRQVRAVRAARAPLRRHRPKRGRLRAPSAPAAADAARAPGLALWAGARGQRRPAPRPARTRCAPAQQQPPARVSATQSAGGRRTAPRDAGRPPCR
jgi:hypothetical protein